MSRNNPACQTEPHGRDIILGSRHKFLLIAHSSTKWLLRLLLHKGLTRRLTVGHAIAQMVRRRPELEPRSAHVVFPVDKWQDTSVSRANSQRCFLTPKSIKHGALLRFLLLVFAKYLRYLYYKCIAPFIHILGFSSILNLHPILTIISFNISSRQIESALVFLMKLVHLS